MYIHSLCLSLSLYIYIYIYKVVDLPRTMDPGLCSLTFESMPRASSITSICIVFNNYNHITTLYRNMITLSYPCS